MLSPLGFTSTALVMDLRKFYRFGERMLWMMRDSLRFHNNVWPKGGMLSVMALRPHAPYLFM